MGLLERLKGGSAGQGQAINEYQAKKDKGPRVLEAHEISDKDRGYSLTDPTHDLNQRKEDETSQEYQARVPAAFQPVQPVANVDYLGRPRD